MRYHLLVLLACAASASAQDSTQTEPSHETGSGLVLIVSGGPSQNGPSMRLLVIREWQLHDVVSLGVASRLVGARGAYPISDTRITGEELYAEFGLSLRPVARLTDQVQIAASAGYGIVILTDQDATYVPFTDMGFTLPLEVEGSVRVWESVGLTAAVSRSLAISSWRTESEVARFPDGYGLNHWTATVGVRAGGW
ncbi:MAG: hypothetical protein AAF170_05805 [Bacteroidota bacterium]